MTVLTAARHFRATSLARLLAASSLIILLVAAAAAQSATDGSTPPGLTPGSPSSSYTLSDLDTVNLFNGSLNLRLPLLRVGGRGGAGYPITLHVEKKWTVHKHFEPGVGSFYYADAGWWSEEAAGWRLFDAGKVDIRSAWREQPAGYPVETLTRITFSAPDGTEYELRDQQSNGQPVAPQSGGYNRGRVFVTSDGSAATFVSDWDIRDDATFGQGFYDDRPDGYLMLRDGTRFRVDDGKMMWMRDRNGNQVTFTYDPTRRVTGVSDSLGRQVTIVYPANGVTYTAINYNGFGGTPWSIKVGQTNLGSALRSGYTLQTIGQLFPELHGGGPTDPSVVSYVELPNGRRYQFQYNPYAEVARVVLPTGGAIEYDYAAGLTNGFASGVFNITGTSGTVINKFIYRRVIERRVYPGGGTGSAYAGKMTYSRPETTTTNAGYIVTEQCTPSGTTGQCGTGPALLAHSRHYFHGSARASFEQKPTAYPAYKDGREYKTENYKTDATTLLRSVEHTFAQRGAVGWWTGDPELAPPNDVRTTQTVTTLADVNPNLVSKVTFAYDQFNNQNDLWEYDYGTGAPPAHPVRHTHTNYVTLNNGVDYTDRSGAHIRHLVSSRQVYSVNPSTGAETLASQSEHRYDEGAFPLLSYGTVTGWSDPGSARGNATTNRQWVNTSNSWLETHTRYDHLGNVRYRWDARDVGLSNPTHFEYASTYAYAFPTTVTSAVPDTTGTYGSAVALVTTTAYDFSTGLVTSMTDSNNKTTSYSYSDDLNNPDPLSRLRKVTRADGGRTKYEYGDTPGNMFVRTVNDVDASRQADSYEYFDGMGRPFRALRYENQDPSKPWVTVDTEYDALGRVKRVSLPYRAAAGAALFSTARWTENAYDTLGRITSLTTKPDNAAITTAYSGDRTLVKDQAGKERIRRTDALGQLTELWEVKDADAATVAIVPFPDHPEAAHGYLTSYLYDPLGNMRRITQGTQQRFFMYDSLGRLVRVKVPEQATFSTDPSEFIPLTDSISGNSQWSSGYIYDANGNLSKRKDARNVIASYSYDALNRSTGSSYQNDPTGTLGTVRKYDFAVNGKGRPYMVGQSGTTTSASYFDQYDSIGHLLSQRQKFETNGVWSGDYSVSRSYNLAGQVTGQTYPSGRSVVYHYDLLGRAADEGAEPAFKGTLGDNVQRTYSSEVRYHELGGVEQERFGTDTPVYNKSFYNGRGQLAEIRVSTHSLLAPGQETNWNRGAIINHYSNSGWGASGGGSDNNGNLLKQEVYIPNDDQISGYFNVVQYYGYDALNRLASVEDKPFNGSPDFYQSYIYDRWGNRTINVGGTWNAPAPQFTASSATNRLAPPAGYTMSYDAAGNLTYDNYSGSGTRAYDGENRLTSAQDFFGQTSTYTYDADGKRVRRAVAGGAAVWQVYGMDGELLAEYAAGASHTSPQKEYGYRGGELLVTTESSTLTNVSQGKPATQSSTGWGGDAARAVDGNTSGAWADGSVSHTNGDAQGWWQVDLQSVQQISRVDFFLMTECCSAHGDFDVKVSDDGVSWSNYYVAGPVDSGNVTPNRTGRYVKVQLRGTDYLALAEVQVWAGSGGSGGVKWLVADQLGTPRMVIDKTGSLADVRRHDYLPFGEEIATDTTWRTTGRGYAADNVRQKFTGYERDSETGLDFAQARYHNSRQGRFLSVDPIGVTPERLALPQQLNMYAYAGNNPLYYTDPFGEMVRITGDASQSFLSALEEAVGVKLDFEKDGKTVKVSGKVPKNLTATQKALLSLIRDKSFVLEVEAVKTDDPNVLVDQYQGLGKMKVDFGDLAKIVQPNATTYAEQAAHILVEANEGRKKGLTQVGAIPEIHDAGLKAGNGVRKDQGLQPRSLAPEEIFPTGIQMRDGTRYNTIRYTVDYGSHVQEVYVKADARIVNGRPEVTPTGTIVAARVIPKSKK